MLVMLLISFLHSAMPSLLATNTVQSESKKLTALSFSGNISLTTENFQMNFYTPIVCSYLRRTASFGLLCVKIGAGVSAVDFLKNSTNKLAESTLAPKGVKSHVHKTKPP